MKPVPNIRFALVLALLVAGVPAPSAARTGRALPSPLRLGDVVRLASERRDEIERRGHGCAQLKQDRPQYLPSPIR
jgi:hypothetical protein